jgi:hypothetical protein
LRSVQDIIHGDTFVCFLDQAGYLLEAKYKDAAAVITGSVLEQHLRELCQKYGVSIRITDDKPKKADTMNADLAGQSVYSKLDQKDVTSWLGLRNEAAHGNYVRYTAEQVRIMIDGIRHFVARYPA